MTTTIYGIKNCDTMKKAQKWLTSNQIPFTFHDYRKEGLDEALLTSFVNKLGWENVLNKRGTTFRNLPEADKLDLNEANAIQLMLAHPAMIKRPILSYQGQWLIGFKPEQYQTLCSA